MATKFRTKAKVLDVSEKLTAEQIETLKIAGAGHPDFWTPSDATNLQLVKKFKKEVKAYYYGEQSHKCCYCSGALQSHQGSYDAEHILDRSSYSQFMFHYENLAVSCKPCNQAKSKIHVLNKDVEDASLSSLSSDYLLVHPHLDEWDEHFTYDEFERIQALENSSKGKFTYTLCGFVRINSLKLSEFFHGGVRGSVQKSEKLIGQLFNDNTSDLEKRKILELLEKLVSDSNHGRAWPVIEMLRNDLDAT